MKYFKLAYDLLTRRIFFYIIVIAELAGVLVLTNTVVSVYNGKETLYEPYRELLDGEGVVIEMFPTFGYGSSSEDIQAIVSEHNYLYMPDFIDLLKEKLEGDTEIYWCPYYAMYAENGGPVPLSGGKSEINTVRIDSTIFQKLKLPLSCGRWPSSEVNDNGEIEVVISGGTNAELNKVYNTTRGKIKIVGILTENTYIPPGMVAPEDNKKQFSIFDYYSPYNSNISMGSPFILMDGNLYDSIDDHSDPNFGPEIFISYGHVDKAAAEKNTEYIKSLGCEIRSIYGEESFGTIREQTTIYLNDIYLRMMPVLIVAAAVVLAGLVGAVSMSVIREMRTFGIFYLCGCKWRDCTKIVLAQMVIIFSAAAVLTAGALAYMNLTNFEYLIGSVFDWNNLYISLAEMAVMYLIAIIIPSHVIRSASPVTVVKESV